MGAVERWMTVNAIHGLNAYGAKKGEENDTTFKRMQENESENSAFVLRSPKTI